MNSKRFLIFAASLFVVISVMSSCATMKPYDPGEKSVAISLATEQELRRFGMNNLVNPYMDVKSILGGWLTDTTVIKISLNLPKETRVYITAEMKGKNGQPSASPYYRDALIDFWDQNTETDTDITVKKMYIEKVGSIRRTCLPGFTFIQKPGAEVYYLPFIGDHPISRPSTIYVQVSTGSGEPAVYTATLE